ncbi:MAG: isocitrate lyase/PEP mutase family protein [Thalassobaculaceae bacterium]
MASLKSKFRKGRILTAPGVFDGVSVRLADAMGFDALYMTGYGTVASHLGLPDAGLASYRDMVERVRTLSELSSAPLICDGDTGYGGLLNVDHTVKGYERAGAAAIQLEDQEFPKKCGHTPNRKVIPIDQAAAKIKVAAEARDSADFLIIARTDARTAHGLDEALRRADAFAEAGADILFVEAPESVEEMEIIGKRFDLPLLVNVVEGGKTPVLTAEQYAEIGYQIAIYPAAGFLAVGHALNSVYSTLKRTGASTELEVPIADFMTFSKAMGFEDVWKFERDHADLETNAEAAE